MTIVSTWKAVKMTRVELARMLGFPDATHVEIDDYGSRGGSRGENTEITFSVRFDGDAK